MRIEDYRKGYLSNKRDLIKTYQLCNNQLIQKSKEGKIALALMSPLRYTVQFNDCKKLIRLPFYCASKNK